MASPSWIRFGRVRNVPVTVELVAHLPLPGGRQVIALTDDMVRREVYDRTDVAFRAREGAEILASGIGTEVTEPTLDVAYGPDESRDVPVVLTAVVTTPPLPGGEPPWAWILAAALGLLTLFAVAMLVRRGRGSSSPG